MKKINTARKIEEGRNGGRKKEINKYQRKRSKERDKEGKKERLEEGDKERNRNKGKWTKNESRRENIEKKCSTKKKVQGHIEQVNKHIVKIQ